MFLVEIRIPHEDRLKDEMEAMRTWLDHQRSAPTGFRTTSVTSGATIHMDFTSEPEARAFAVAFGGNVRTAPAREIGL